MIMKIFLDEQNIALGQSGSDRIQWADLVNKEKSQIFMEERKDFLRI
jgi:hypothetical protein